MRALKALSIRQANSISCMWLWFLEKCKKLSHAMANRAGNQADREVFFSTVKEYVKINIASGMRDIAYPTIGPMGSYALRKGNSLLK